MFNIPLYSKTLFLDHIEDKTEESHEDDRNSTDDQAGPVPDVCPERG